MVNKEKVAHFVHTYHMNTKTTKVIESTVDLFHSDNLQTNS